MNANVMSRRSFRKLCEHIGQTGRYPPLIVRPAPDEPGAYQVLDGHHRWRALERLKHEQAVCDVWCIDDEQALVLLATLNRLQGADDPHKRAALVGRLHERFKATQADLERWLPDSANDLQRLIALNRPTPKLRAGATACDLPRSVHFFLSADQQRALERVLKDIGGKREQALMVLVGWYERRL